MTNMDTFLRLIEVEVHRALQGARIIGLIHVERNVKEGYTQFHGPQRVPDPVPYVEDGYVIAWQRDHHAGHAGEGENWGTHRAQANNGGEVMLIHGHYDIPSREEALKDMLERAKVTA
jgi:hypothetical protein